MEYYIDYYESPLTRITLGSDGNALIGLWLEGQKYYCEKFSKEAKRKDLDVFNETKEWLDIYFSGENPGFTPKLNEQGSDFRHEVWEILKRIPYGKPQHMVKLRMSLLSTGRVLECLVKP